MKNITSFKFVMNWGVIKAESEKRLKAVSNY